jgi:hypothetical protein
MFVLSLSLGVNPCGCGRCFRRFGSKLLAHFSSVRCSFGFDGTRMHTLFPFKLISFSKHYDIHKCVHRPAYFHDEDEAAWISETSKTSLTTQEKKQLQKCCINLVIRLTELSLFYVGNPTRGLSPYRGDVCVPQSCGELCRWERKFLVGPPTLDRSNSARRNVLLVLQVGSWASG